MASPRPEITPAAIEELESAAKWYRDHSVAAEEEFLDAFQSAYRLLAEYPNSGRQYLYGTRSLLLPKFRYIIVYLIRDEAPVVIALAHTSRRPGYWRDRISER